MMNITQDKIENDIVKLLLREDADILKRIDSAVVIKREFTGVGFFTYYNCDDISYETDMIFSGVAAKLNNNIDVGFVFLIRNNGLIVLEGYTYGEPWPRVIESCDVYLLEKSTGNIL